MYTVMDMITIFISGVACGVLITVVTYLLAIRKRDNLIRQGKYVVVDGSKDIKLMDKEKQEPYV